MARRERVVTITTKGSRDIGKMFKLREMPADAGEWWAIRALSVLGNAGIKLPSSVDAGMAGLAAAEAATGVASALFVVGLRMLPGVDTLALKPLLDEMMTCVQYQPPGGHPAQDLYDGEMSQVEEIATRLQLRAAVLELHLGFSIAGVASTSDTTPPSAAPAS